MLFENRTRIDAETRKTSFSAVYLDGKTIELDWLASNTQFIAVTQENKIIALIPDAKNEDQYSDPVESLMEIDLSTGNNRELLKFSPSAWIRYATNKSGTRLIIHATTAVNENRKKTYHSINLLTGEASKIDVGNLYDNAPALLYSISDSTFIACSLDQIYEIDADKLSVNLKFDLENLQKNITKGGL